MAEVRVGPQFYEGEDCAVWIDGKEYRAAALEGFVRFGLKYQFGLLEDILKEHNVLPLDSTLVPVAVDEEIGDGWKMTQGTGWRTQHLFFAIKVPFLWDHEDRDRARQTLREKLQKLGDAIWGSRPDAGR
jgi:hypothetical protein